MSGHDVVMGIAALFGGVNLVVVVTLAVKWGRWTGVVDTRLEHIEQTLKGGA